MSYSLSGTDASLFNINSTTGAVTFKNAPDYDSPADNGGNNAYNINVIATDSIGSTTRLVPKLTISRRPPTYGPCRRCRRPDRTGSSPCRGTYGRR